MVEGPARMTGPYSKILHDDGALYGCWQALPGGAVLRRGVRRHSAGVPSHPPQEGRPLQDVPEHAGSHNANRATPRPLPVPRARLHYRLHCMVPPVKQRAI